VDFSQRPFRVHTYSKTYLAESVIVSTGASSKHLNVPGEKEYTGRGVSYCATCDGAFFKDKQVIVVGGGDSALEEGLFLTRYASMVTIVHRRDELRAGAVLEKRARTNPKIRFIWNSVVTEVLGEKVVTAVRLQNTLTGEQCVEPTDGVFIFIGHTPNTELFKGQLDLDSHGYIEVDRRMHTSVHGVFAAGEAADPDFRQVITSAGMGAAAAMEAGHFLDEIVGYQD
jgi:thioredoxin reductase (NADPH)